MAETLIKNGIIFDGNNTEPVKGDLLIRDGRVAAIGEVTAAKSARVIDAKNMWVMPGFIDVHTHYDAEVEVMPGLEESVKHGVTSVICGNCSLSCALGNEDDVVNLYCRVENLPAELVEKWIKGKLSWRSPSEYYDHLEKAKLGPNVGSFLGHSEIRIAAMGLDDALSRPKATRSEISKMKDYVKEAMNAGFLGLSIDLLPFHRMFKKPYKGVSVPSQQAHHTEYSKLASVVRKYRRVLQAVPNALSKISVAKIMSMSTGLFRRPLKTTVIAAMDTKSDRKVHRLAPFVAHSFNKFLNADVIWQALPEPFLNFADGPITPLFEEFPSAVRAISSTPKERMAMFADPEFRAQFRKEWYHKGTAVFHRDLDDMWVIACPKNKSYIGKSFGQIAREQGEDALEVFMNLVANYDTAIRWKSEVTNDREEIRVKLLASSVTMPGFSDAGAHNRNMAFHDFALQLLKQAQKYPHILPVKEAVHRLTRRIADWLGIDTGSLEVGRIADAVIVDPSKLQSNLGAPIELKDKRIGGAMRMLKKSDKVVKDVLVGGEAVFKNYKPVAQLGKKRFGRVLRSQL